MSCHSWFLKVVLMIKLSGLTTLVNPPVNVIVSWPPIAAKVTIVSQRTKFHRISLRSKTFYFRQAT